MYQASYFKFDILFPLGVEDYILFVRDPLGYVDVGIQLDFWRGTYNDPLTIK